MREKDYLFEELSEFIKGSKKEHPDLKKQFELYLDDKKKYDDAKGAVIKEQKSKTYGVKYK